MTRARQWLAVLLLVVFVYITAGLTPYFVRNLRLQQYVEALTHSADAATRPVGDLRAQVVAHAHELGLPVAAQQVLVESRGSRVHISVRYVVAVDFPGYTVKLHFAPSAGW